MRTLLKLLFTTAIVSAVFTFYGIWYIKFTTENNARSAAIEPGTDARKGGDLPAVPSPSRDKMINPHVSDYVRDILRVALPELEEGVLGMNISETLGKGSNVSFHENRLLAKLQGLDREPARCSDCVIRVAIHCGKKQHCFNLQAGHEKSEDVFSWQKFSCVPPVLLCDIERRLVAEVTPVVMRSSDVIIFGMVGGWVPIDKLIGLRPPGQLWAFTTCESPQMRWPFVSKNPGAGNPYNMSMYYTHDADLYAPYGHFRRQPDPNPPSIGNKTKLIAWMASHCSKHYLSWKRLPFVQHLQKYIHIDMYGRCGSLGRVQDKMAVLRQYKFYLALENNECREYITEKASQNSFANGAVPIVYGSRPEDYARAFPANSYIHLQEFDSVEQFVDFIHALDHDVDKYRKYFSWHSEGKVVQNSLWTFMSAKPEISVCYLLRKLVHLSIYPDTAWQKKVPDFGAWLREQCPTEGPRKVLGFDVHPP